MEKGKCGERIRVCSFFLLVLGFISVNLRRISNVAKVALLPPRIHSMVIILVLTFSFVERARTVRRVAELKNG